MAQKTRGPKSATEAVIRSAKQAEETLSHERHTSVLQVAKTLNEINEGEGFAHIDARVEFLERQVELLRSRRDEIEQTEIAEFRLMRARIEDSLRAIDATSKELHAYVAKAVADVEGKFASKVAASGAHQQTVIDSLTETMTSIENRSSHSLDAIVEEWDGAAEELHAAFQASFEKMERELQAARSEIEAEARLKDARTREELQAELKKTSDGLAALSEQTSASIAGLSEQTAASIADMSEQAATSLKTQTSRVGANQLEEAATLREAINELRADLSNALEQVASMKAQVARSEASRAEIEAEVRLALARVRTPASRSDESNEMETTFNPRTSGPYVQPPAGKPLPPGSIIPGQAGRLGRRVPRFTDR